LFLATRMDGNTAWHLEATLGNEAILQEICDLTKNNLTAEEIKNKLF